MSPFLKWKNQCIAAIQPSLAPMYSFLMKRSCPLFKVSWMALTAHDHYSGQYYWIFIKLRTSNKQVFAWVKHQNRNSLIKYLIALQLEPSQSKFVKTIVSGHSMVTRAMFINWNYKLFTSNLYRKPRSLTIFFLSKNRKFSWFKYFSIIKPFIIQDRKIFIYSSTL